MAIVKNNVVTKGLSGKLGRDLVFKVYGEKTVVCAYPRRSTVAPSVRQLSCRERFARAVAQVRFWLKDTEKRAFLERLRKQWGSFSAYHAGIRYFMKQAVSTASASVEEAIAAISEVVVPDYPAPVAVAVYVNSVADRLGEPYFRGEAKFDPIESSPSHILTNYL